jgi:hypothetical protein
VNLAVIVFLKGRFARRRKKAKDSFILLFTGAALSDMTLDRQSGKKPAFPAILPTT